MMLTQKEKLLRGQKAPGKYEHQRNQWYMLPLFESMVNHNVEARIINWDTQWGWWNMCTPLNCDLSKLKTNYSTSNLLNSSKIDSDVPWCSFGTFLDLQNTIPSKMMGIFINQRLWCLKIGHLAIQSHCHSMSWSHCYSLEFLWCTPLLSMSRLGVLSTGDF
jgi:hypothetical protein